MVEGLSKTLKDIEKKHGKGMMRMASDVPEIPRICSTGSYSLDLVMNGGIPEGRIMELYGGPSSGKSSVCLHFIREAQKVGKKCAYIDMEVSYDPVWAENLGVNNEDLYYTQPDSGDMAFDIVEQLVNSGEIDLIIVDSVGGLLTKAQIDGEYGDAHMAQLARLMSQGLPKLVQVMKRNKAAVVFINQVRVNIGGYSPQGIPTTQMGGRALPFWSSVRWEVKRKDVIGKSDKPVGFITNIKVVKSKVSPPFRRVDVSFYVGGEDGCTFGIDNEVEIIDVALQSGVLRQAGAWVYYDVDGEELKWNGKAKTTEYFKANPELMLEIKDKAFATFIKAQPQVDPESFAAVTSGAEVKESKGTEINMETGEVE